MHEQEVDEAGWRAGDGELAEAFFEPTVGADGGHPLSGIAVGARQFAGASDDHLVRLHVTGRGGCAPIEYETAHRVRKAASTSAAKRS